MLERARLWCNRSIEGSAFGLHVCYWNILGVLHLSCLAHASFTFRFSYSVSYNIDLHYPKNTAEIDRHGYSVAVRKKTERDSKHFNLAPHLICIRRCSALEQCPSPAPFCSNFNIYFSFVFCRKDKASTELVRQQEYSLGIAYKKKSRRWGTRKE